MAKAKKVGPTHDPEQVAHVTAIRRPCRGPLVVDAELWQGRLVQWQALEAAKDLEGARSLILELQEAAQELAGPRFRVSIPAFVRVVTEPNVRARGDVWAQLRRVALPLIRLRAERIGKPCGWDLNSAIVQEPFDGAQHETTCPQCGNVITWTAPVF